jgi:transposase
MISMAISSCGAQSEVTMDVIVPACCGIDVHHKSLVACIRVLGPGGQVSKEVRTFATMTTALGELAAWLVSRSVTHVAIESTGVFWKPVWNILEPTVHLLLVNPRDVAQVPGRKTDVGDAEWIAQLLQCGLLRGSFVPPRPIREMRDLTRSRTSLEQQRAAVVNRIHKVLEDANIKLGAVVTDITGVSGRAILDAIVAGTSDPSTLAALARGRLRKKLVNLREAVTGQVTDHHRFLLRRLLHELTFLESEIDEYDQRLRDVSGPFDEALELLDTIPGINRRAGENLLAEVGPDMTVFPSAKKMASWAAICPGNYQTGGRQARVTIRKGNRWLRRALTQAAWAGVRKRGSYCGAQYRRLMKRRGKHRAIIAVAHSQLVAVYYILRDRVRYEDLGADHFDRLTPAALTRYYVKRLQQLGHGVTLEPAA